MPEPIPSNVPGFFGNQFHQLAMYFPHPCGLQSAREHWEGLGYVNWAHDSAELKGILFGREVVTRGEMWFNYDIMPLELELLHYRGLSRWDHVDPGAKPFPSHMSVYTDDVLLDTKRMSDMLGYGPFHRFITQNHSNPAVAGKKRFIESIFATHSLLGYDTKFIQKVPHDYDDEQWLLANIT